MMSNLQHSAIFMFLIFLPMVISRECYGCTSSISAEDCEVSRTIVKCNNSSQPCAEFSVYSVTDEKQQFYLRGCATTCLASDFEICLESDVKCSMTCCSSDLCNGVSDPVVSGLLLIVTTSFMYLF